MAEERFETVARPERSKYVLIDHEAEGSPEIGEELYLDYQSEGKPQRILFHTEVSDAYAGQGLASGFVRNVVEDVIAQGYAIVPVCPYVAAWLPRHPEYAESVVRPTLEHLRALQAAEQ